MARNLKLMLIGDTNVQRPDPDSVFEPNAGTFKSADVLFCNLETVVADLEFVGTPLVRGPRADEAVFGSFVRAGVNVVNMANNPIAYWGVDALVRSLDVVDRYGVVRAGAGRNLAEARRPGIIERNGTKVAFVCRNSVGLPEGAATDDRPGTAYFRIRTSYESHPRLAQAPGTPPITRTTPNAEDAAALAEDLAVAKAAADVVVLYWHWGLSMSSDTDGELTEYQTEMGRFAIDNGADLVVGGHCHEVQPIEVYKGKVIAYSLGNYMHEQIPERFGKQAAMLLRCDINDGEITDVSFLPGAAGPGSLPALYHPPSQEPRVVELLQTISAEFGTEFEITPDAVHIVLSSSGV